MSLARKVKQVLINQVLNSTESESRNVLFATIYSTAGGVLTPGGGTTSTSTTVETVTKNQSTSSLLPLCQLTRIEEPTSFGEALDSKFSKQWRDATDIEYASLLENNAWKPVKRPEDRKVIGCKWVFRVKYDGHEKVEWFKE